jgi:hypothetical protein
LISLFSRHTPRNTSDREIRGSWTRRIVFHLQWRVTPVAGSFQAAPLQVKNNSIGTGTVVFSGGGLPYDSLGLSSGTLTIGPGITVRGQKAPG